MKQWVQTELLVIVFAACEEQHQPRLGQLHHIYRGPEPHLPDVSRGVRPEHEGYSVQGHCQGPAHAGQGRFIIIWPASREKGPSDIKKSVDPDQPIRDIENS